MGQQPQYTPEIDFRELVRKPHKLFGYTYLFFLGIVVVLGILYVRNLNAIGANSVPPFVLADSSAFVVEIPFQAPGVLPPIDVRAAAVPTDEVLARGRELYRANCASCHGDNGQGDGAAGILLNPRPRNFHQADGWTNGAKISEIYRTLEEGIVRNGMASYSYMSPADRFAMTHVVRTFHPSAPADTEQEILALETTYQLSRGRTIPAQIPVRIAAARLADEYAPVAARIRRGQDAVAAPADPGAALFRTVTRDPARALTGLHAQSRRITAVDDLVRVVSADPVGLGFRASVVHLTAEQWALLHTFVTREVR